MNWSVIDVLLGWNSRFNKRILRSHLNVWTFIESLKKEQFVFRQLIVKFSCGEQKKKTKGVLALEVRLKTLGTRFENDKIDRKQYLEGLSFFVANKNKLLYLFVSQYLYLYVFFS